MHSSHSARADSLCRRSLESSRSCRWPALYPHAIYRNGMVFRRSASEADGDNFSGMGAVAVYSRQSVGHVSCPCPQRPTALFRPPGSFIGAGDIGHEHAFPLLSDETADPPEPDKCKREYSEPRLSPRQVSSQLMPRRNDPQQPVSPVSSMRQRLSAVRSLYVGGHRGVVDCHDCTIPP